MKPKSRAEPYKNWKRDIGQHVLRLFPLERDILLIWITPQFHMSKNINIPFPSLIDPKNCSASFPSILPSTSPSSCVNTNAKNLFSNSLISSLLVRRFLSLSDLAFSFRLASHVSKERLTLLFNTFCKLFLKGPLGTSQLRVSARVLLRTLLKST